MFRIHFHFDHFVVNTYMRRVHRSAFDIEEMPFHFIFITTTAAAAAATVAAEKKNQRNVECNRTHYEWWMAVNGTARSTPSSATLNSDL